MVFGMMKVGSWDGRSYRIVLCLAHDLTVQRRRSVSLEGQFVIKCVDCELRWGCGVRLGTESLYTWKLKRV